VIGASVPVEQNARPENPARTSQLLAGLFPSSVIACELRETADSALLLPEEAGSCDGFRPKRLAEFAAGRLCARRALDGLGFPDFALRQNVDRTPRWPAGVVGSITHTVGFCGAVVERRANVAGLGVDAEIVARVGRELWRQVFTASEFAQLDPLGAAQRERLAALVFSAKEAFYKCQFALTARWLEFSDVSVEVRPDSVQAGSFVVRSASTQASWILRGLAAEGRYRFDGALVVTGIVIGTHEASVLAPRNPLAVA